MKKTSFFILVVLAVCGCGRNDNRASLFQSPLELNARISVKDSRDVKKIDDMKPDDVIVAVNGYPLLKRDYDVWTGQLLAMIRKHAKGNLGEAEKYFEQARVQFLDQFIRNRLLIDDARTNNVMDNAALVAKIKAVLEERATANKITADELLSKYGNADRHLIYQIAERELVSELVKQRIPPVTEVDMTFVSNAQAQVTLENNIIGLTNSVRRQMFENWRNEIAAGKLTFDALVEKYGPDGRFEINESGEWETVARGDIDDETIAELVFAAAKGEILPIQEDDDGIDMIMVSEIIPARRDKEGKIAMSEQRILKRIRMEKEPLFLRQSNDKMFSDLKIQMQLQAIDSYVENLVTNGLNTIVYPHGRNLF